MDLVCVAHLDIGHADLTGIYYTCNCRSRYLIRARTKWHLVEQGGK
jgi:hypothetical protein